MKPGQSDAAVRIAPAARISEEIGTNTEYRTSRRILVEML